MTNIYISGALFGPAKPGGKPLTFISHTEQACDFIPLNELPDEIADQLAQQGEALNLIPLGLVAHIPTT